MKLLIITAEVHKMLPGQGQGIFRKLLAAKWIAPCTPTVRPLYRSADVLACLARREAGEVPVPIYRWQSCLGSDRPVSHLLPLNGTKATLRLSFATADVVKIEEGVGRLGQAF